MAHKDEGPAGDFKRITWEYVTGQKKNGFPWGPHRLPLMISFEGVSLVAEKCAGGFVYKREARGRSVEKELLVAKGNLQLSPVEPFHLPVALSYHLLIALEQPVTIEPRTIKNIFITFPLELSTAINRRQKGEHILDAFTLCRSKFTLYGSIKSGLVCKYWQSAVYHSIPVVNPLAGGVMKLSIQNTSGRWADVNKVVFSAQGMKIYYNQNLVSLKAAMKIIGSLADSSVDIIVRIWAPSTE